MKAEVLASPGLFGNVGSSVELWLLLALLVPSSCTAVAVS